MGNSNDNLAPKKIEPQVLAVNQTQAPRITYSLDALQALKASPHSKKRPDNLAIIPGITAPRSKL